MREPPCLSDPELVTRQYADSSRLDARIRLYQLYDPRPESLPRWLFGRLGLRAGERVVEFGCGTGALWSENADRIPAELEVTLSDRSRGMLETARTRLGASGRPFAFACMDVQQPGLPPGSADVVIASHMLYHVPDRGRALRAIERLLAPEGRFHCVTNDWTHLIELRELVARFGLRTSMRAGFRDPDFFDLERAARELSAHFPRLRLERRATTLDVTDADVLVAYVASMASEPASGLGGEQDALEALREHARWMIEHMGSVRISVSAGAFEARRE